VLRRLERQQVDFVDGKDGRTGVIHNENTDGSSGMANGVKGEAAGVKGKATGVTGKATGVIGMATSMKAGATSRKWKETDVNGR
jgi:hypothetical protein